MATLSKIFIGFDFSTQQVKAVVIDSDLHVLHEANVVFQSDFPEFKTNSGVHKGADGGTVTSPVLMWVAALDLILDRLRQQGVDLTSIGAISGAAQQHGSVYWARNAKQTLRNLNPAKQLVDQLGASFSVTDCPIWMDSSTGEQCRSLEEAVGGPQELAKLTGSRAYHRFTGNQIAKIAQNHPEAYVDTERISLVSSFVCSLLLGDYAPIDVADASGMNLMNLVSRDWDQGCLDACAPDLRRRLGAPVASDSNLGPICSYFVERYGFRPGCSVVVFTGDNPASMVGMNLKPGDVAISLGTSDTVLVWMSKPQTNINVHVMCNPMQRDAYMGMLCFKNGAFTRERIRESTGCQTWDEFNALLSKTKPGNDGNIGFFFDMPEILPDVASGDHRFGPDDRRVGQFPAGVEARAVLEHQCLAKKLHALFLGYTSGGRVVVTGGASANREILQMLADVFNCSVCVSQVSNSAALGSALRAKNGLEAQPVSFSDMFSLEDEETIPIAQPHPDAVQVYDTLIKRYAALERVVVSNNDLPV